MEAGGSEESVPADLGGAGLRDELAATAVTAAEPNTAQFQFDYYTRSLHCAVHSRRNKRNDGIYLIPTNGDHPTVLVDDENVYRNDVPDRNFDRSEN